MQTCSGVKGKRHEDVAYADGFSCPVCEAIEQRDDVRERLIETQEALRDANEKMMELDRTIENLEYEKQAAENVNER